MRKIVVARLVAVSAVALLTVLGCSSEPATGTDEGNVKDCSGARLDGAGVCRTSTGKFAPKSCCAPVPNVSHRCDVVGVDHSVSELEEGFGSYYEITDEGFSDADEDAEDIDVETVDGALEVSLGHHSFDKADGDRIEALPVGDDGVRAYTVAPSSGGEKYTIRIFGNDLGVILFQQGKGKPERLATLDCRGALDAEPEQADVAAMDSCNVVWVNDGLNGSLFEEGLGSIYDIDDDGFPNADSDSTSVDLVAAAGEREVGIGQAGFSEADGDSIEIEDADELITYVVRPSGSEEIYSVNIFRSANDAEIPGIGVVLYQESASATAESLAIIDCRGIATPDEI